MDTAATDNQLVEQVQSGDREAYADLIRRHHPKVIGLCSSLLGNLTEGEDAAQDVFLKAYQSLSSFRSDSHFSTWLYRIAYNHCLDTLRSRKRKKTESWENLIEEKGDKVQHLLTNSAPGESSAENQDLINRVLSTLSEDHKNILILREVYGFSYEEVAQITKSSLDSVKGKLKRARQDLFKKAQHFLAAKTVKISEAENG